MEAVKLLQQNLPVVNWAAGYHVG